MAFEILMALDVSTDAATNVEDEPQNFNVACAGRGQKRTADSEKRGNGERG